MHAILQMWRCNIPSLQNCVRHWFEMKSNALNFWRLFQKLFLARTIFQKQKQNFISKWMEGGKARPRFAWATEWGPTPSIAFEMKLCFCFWNLVRSKKSFWNNLQKLSAFDSISNQWCTQFCIHEVDKTWWKTTSEFSKNGRTSLTPCKGLICFSCCSIQKNFV